MKKPVLTYANNKGADQPAHPRSLISAFIVRCLDSIFPLVSMSKISSLYLASVAVHRSVWSESSLCAQWVAKDPSFLHADSEDSDQTWWMPRLIWVFDGRTLTLLVLSCCGSYGLVLCSMSFCSCPSAFEPHHEKTCHRGLRPGKTQTGLLSWSD